jgi:class 3 adenylate cyclase
VIACSSCGTANEAGRRFCIQCGNSLAAGCPVCGTVNPPEARFCGHCGNPLAAAVPVTSAGRQAVVPDSAGGPGAATATHSPIAERRLVSVAFVDLVGFTTASERRDAEDTRDLLTRYYETARQIMGRHGGTIEKFIGDAVMAVWGTPTAQEDDAERAVRAAIELVAAVPRLSADGQELQARAGVLTGEAAVTIGDVGQGMVAGDLVNTASRLQSAATPGTVLVGETTYRAASLAIAFEDAGERELKGKEMPAHVWRAVSVVARRGGGGRAAILEPPFVGREDELVQLKDLFHATGREGKPRLVTVSGIAGIGKSRLLWELEKYLDGVIETVYWHDGRSPSYGEGISYWALAEMIRGRSGIAETDEPATARGRVREMLARFVPDDADRRWIEPRVMGLLALEDLPGESRDELFTAWRTLFERMAEQAPVVLGFWDLQWADQGTLDFIEHVLGWARSSPIFVLAEARPELFDRRPGWGSNVRSATLIHLDPLPVEDMRRLLLGLVPDLPDDAMLPIVRRAEGVPLYAVETLRMLIDQGVLETRDGRYALTGPVPELAVPETLHALIAARLDALVPDERALLVDGSVLGVSFSLPAVGAVSHMPDGAVVELLERLVRREFLTLDADSRSPERGQYRFLQGVVREVAYQSLAKQNRQAKHLAAARFFEALGDDELAGVLATHYLAAQRAARVGPEADALAAQARVALRAAADRATALHDLVGAVTYLEEALSVTTEPAEQAALHERAISVAGDAARFQRAYDHARDARALFGQLGDRLAVLRAYALEAGVQLAEHRDQTTVTMLTAALAETADLPPSPEAAQAQVELARALMLAGSDDAVPWCDRVLEQPSVAAPGVLLEAIITKGTALQRVARVVEAEALLRGAIVIADAQSNLAAALRARNNLRVMLQDVNLRDAVALIREVYEMARKYGQRTWVLHSVSASLDVAFRLGTWDAFLDDARAEVSEDDGYYFGWLRAEEARRMTYRGKAQVAERIVDEVLATKVIIESAQATTWSLAAKADAQVAQGRFDEAFAVARSAWSRSAEVDTGFHAALFAAAAAGDISRVQATLDVWHDLGTGQLPLHRAFEAMAASLHALLEMRWDDSRAAYVTAEQLAEGVAAETLLARFRLAFAHLAGARFGEGIRAAEQADAFFGERGAQAYVDAYRTAAFAHPATPAVGADVAERSRVVRAAG